MKFEMLYIIGMSLVAAVIGCSGKMPSNLGAKDGKLASCPNSPNCVSSQSADKTHKIDPIVYKCGRSEAHSILLDVIKEMKRTKIITDQDDYIHAEFASAIFGFVDDVEFYFVKDSKLIDIRSASRLGYSDLGVNRKRAGQITDLFIQKERNLDGK